VTIVAVCRRRKHEVDLLSEQFTAEQPRLDVGARALLDDFFGAS
jgi:hypothetical protein